MDAKPVHNKNPATHRAAVARYYAKKKQDPEWVARRAAALARWRKQNPERVNEQSRKAYAAKRDARLAAAAAAADAASETAPKECQPSLEHAENSLP